MTTNYHSAIATGANANASVINSPLESLDAAIENIRNEMRLSARQFAPTSGTPAEGNVGTGGDAAASWRLDDSATEYVGVGIEYKGSGATTVDVDIWYAMESATSGAVVLAAGAIAAADGENFAAAATASTAGSTVPGTAKFIKKATISLSITVAAGDVIRLRVGRNGTSGSDTATGDLHIVAVTVRFS